MDIVVGTVIVYLFPECRPLMDKTVRGQYPGTILIRLYIHQPVIVYITCCMVH